MHYEYPYPEFFDGVPRADFQALSGNLVIYGAGFQGLLTAHLLEKQRVQALCFCDQDEAKQGTVYYGLPVLSPEDTKRRYPEATVIVTPYTLAPAYRYVVDTMQYRSAITPFSLFLECDTDEFDKLKELPFWYHPVSFGYHIEHFLRKCINLLTDHNLLATELSVTQVCNLRCKDCTSLMPCYTKPHHFELEDAAGDLDRVLQDRTFHHIFLEGGEPFLWPSLPALLEEFVKRENLLNLIIITNGTVIPSKALLNILKNPKLTIRISDYGALSKTDELVSLFKENGVKHAVLLQKWYPFAALRRIPLQGEALERVVENCCKMGGRGSPYIADGKLFQCPLQGNLHNLGILISPEEDYVDLRKENGAALQQKISELFCFRHIPKVCSHCNGRGFTSEEVPPARQLAPGEKLQVRFE